MYEIVCVTVLVPMMARFSVRILPAASCVQEVAPLESHMAVCRPFALLSVRLGGVVDVGQWLLARIELIAESGRARLWVG